MEFSTQTHTPDAENGEEKPPPHSRRGADPRQPGGARKSISVYENPSNTDQIISPLYISGFLLFPEKNAFF